MKRTLILMLTLILCFCSITACAEQDTVGTEAKQEAMNMIRVTVGENTFLAELADTTAAMELKELLKDGPIIMSASNYGGFEKVCELGTDLTTDDTQTTTAAGDIMLYSGDNIVIFYGSNSWAYTRLGRVIDEDIPKLRDILSGSEREVILTATED